MSSFVKIEEIAAILKNIGIDLNNFRIAVAVSGGGDSMALISLMHELAKQHNGKILALTVDHGLRAESSKEAQALHEILSAKGIEHKILNWEGDKPKTRVEEKAREARYNLLVDECKRQGFEYLAIAHNIEDKVETFWMRLLHGSGLDGLASVSMVRKFQGMKIIRPLLAFNRSQLRNTCKHYDFSWFEDPMNRDAQFLRVKLREFEDLLAAEGLTPKRLDKTLQKLEEARQSLEFMVDTMLPQLLERHAEGYINLDFKNWQNYPADIQRRILDSALNFVYPQTYSTGFDLLEDTRKEILEEGFAGKTLSGCEIFFDKSGDIVICRESDRVQENIPLNSEEVVWDKRCKVKSKPDESIFIGALGEEGLAVLRKNKELKSKLEALPYKIKRSIPAIWGKDGLLAVPALGYYCPDCSDDVKMIDISLIN